MQKTTKILRHSQPARLVLKLANKLHMYPESKDKVLFTELVENLKKHKKVEPKMKSLRGFGNVLFAMGIVDYDDDGLYQLVDYGQIKEWLRDFPCTNEDLQRAGDTIWPALMINGPDAKEFLQIADDIFNYERKCQKALIPRIVSDIKEQCEKRMAQQKFKGKPIIYDIGCGDGAIAIELARKMPHATIYAYDPNVIAIKKVNADKPKELTNLTFLTKPLPEDVKVHMALCINVLHDVEHPAQFVQMVSKKLHNIGIAMFVDPTVSIHKEKNLFNLQVTEALALGALDCIHSNDCIHAMGPATGKETLLKYIESNGFRVNEDLQLADNPFYHCFKAEKNPSGEQFKYPFDIGKYLKTK